MKSITPITIEGELVNDDQSAHLIPPSNTTTNDNNSGHHSTLADKENPNTTFAAETTPAPAEYVVDAHPPNAPPGGQWGKQHFRGRLTAAATIGGVLVACVPGLLLLLFRLDERNAYLAKDGQLYDVTGKCLGKVEKLKFVPDRPRS